MQESQEKDPKKGSPEKNVTELCRASTINIELREVSSRVVISFKI